MASAAHDYQHFVRWLHLPATGASEDARRSAELARGQFAGAASGLTWLDAIAAGSGWRWRSLTELKAARAAAGGPARSWCRNERSMADRNSLAKPGNCGEALKREPSQGRCCTQLPPGHPRQSFQESVKIGFTPECESSSKQRRFVLLG